MHPIRRSHPVTERAAPSHFAKLLDVERRLAEDIRVARRRAEAFVESVRMSVDEREARLTRVLSEGFPDLEQRVAAQQQHRVETLVAEARDEARRFAAIDDDTVRRLANDVVDRLLGDS